MGITERARAVSAARLLRKGNVLAFPFDVEGHRMERLIRQWAPAATRPDDDTWQVTPTLHLRGPVACDEHVRRRADLPDATVAAYVAVALSDPPYAAELGGVALLLGLGRRLGGRVRLAVDDGRWFDPDQYPVHPVVQAPHRLSRDELLALLAPHLSNLRFDDSEDPDDPLDPDDPEYGDADLLVSDTVSVSVTTGNVPCHPLVRRQPWCPPDGTSTEYAVLPNHSDEMPQPATDESLRITDVLLTATGGLLLDDDGFPWST